MIDLKEMMTPVTCTLDETASIRSAVEMMKEHKWDIIPVTNIEGQLLGIFTKSKLFTLILEKQSLSEPIGHYIKTDIVSTTVNTSYDEIKEMVKNSHVGTGVVLDDDGHVIGLLTKTDKSWPCFDIQIH